MKIAVFGAGATGGHFAVRLALAGHEVSVVARGTHLEAIRRDGLRLVCGSETLRAEVKASDRAEDLGPQDVVIVGVKATALADVAGGLSPLVGPQTTVLFPQNGMPWWYPLELKDRPEPPALPDFALSEAFLRYMKPAQIVGGSIYSANELAAPGVVQNNSPDHNRIDVGAITAAGESRADTIRGAFEAADIIAPPVADIREVVWRKLLANMSGSVIALVTRNRSSISRHDPELREIFRRVVHEGLAVSAAHGYPLGDVLDPDRMVEKIPEHKPSILQDYEQGRPMEIGQIVRAPQAFARAAGIATPTLDALSAVATRLARDRGLY